MNIYFIAGASGSGKTAIMPYLKEILGERFVIHDFDEIGVPEGADKKWRQQSINIWLERLLAAGKDACLLGQAPLGEIFASPAAKRLKQLNFCHLEVHDVERIRRLKQRGKHGVDQHMLNWAAWLRMHLADPQWRQDVIKEDAWEAMDFGNLDKLQSWEGAANIKIIDTTDLVIETVAKKIAEWVQGKEQAKVLCGSVYRHYKDKYYKVIDIAKHSETEEEMVVYRALYGDGELYVRPLSMFLEKIEVNGKLQLRFEKV